MKTTKTLLLVLILCVANQVAAKEPSEKDYEKIAVRVHKSIFSIDTHNDAALRILNPKGRYPAGSTGQVTFDLMQKGGLDASVFAIFVSQGARDDSSSAKAVTYVKEQLAAMKAYTQSRGDAALAQISAELKRNKKRGVTSVVLGIENGYAIGKDIDNLGYYRREGVRMITLCHSKHNDICDSSTDTLAGAGGLTEFGKAVVERMNSLGIIVDVSHASKNSVMQVLQVSKYPIVASHSGVYAVNASPRNLSDEEIRGIAAKGGLVQIVSLKSYLSSKPKEQVSVKEMADHIDYVKNLVGIEHVGVGTDFDGGGGVVGMEDASKMRSLTVELLKRGYSKRELKLFWGGNFMRILDMYKKSK